MNRNGMRNNFFRACCVVCALAIPLIGTGLSASAQIAPAELSFEVATVKPVDPSQPFDPHHYWAHVNPAGASYWSMTMVYLIVYAYEVQPFQVIGPDWTSTERYDIEARFPEGTDKKDDRRMLQALLKDRFQLSFHIEERQLEGYALIVGKHGEKLKPSLPDPVNPETADPSKPADNPTEEAQANPKITKNKDGSSTADIGKRGTQTLKIDQENQIMHIERSKMTMAELAERLSNCLGSDIHKVDDETGIKGTYQVALDCPLPRSPSSAMDNAGTPPSVPQDNFSLTRSLDALGLKLEKHTFLQKVYVIDHVERPSAN